MSLLRKCLALVPPSLVGIDDKETIAILIGEKAKQYDIDVRVIASIVLQESGGNCFASRYEEAFYHKYIAHLTRKTLPGYVPNFPPTLATEKRHRATSWGLMQVMGETARETGYTGRYLNSLILPEDNLDVGCRFFRQLLNSISSKLDEKERYNSALIRWNNSKTYPAKIWGHIESGLYQRILLQ